MCLQTRGLPTSLTGADWLACREYQSLYAREKELHDTTLKDAKALRTERDQCIGEVTQLQFQLRALKIELDHERNLKQLAVTELESRWPWWSWLGIGAGVGAGAVVVGIIFLP